MKSAIEQEIEWCEAHMGESANGIEFEKGFIAGLKQALRFEKAVEQPLAVDGATTPDEECFSCKKGEGMPVEYIAKQYGYKLCKFHADMGLVAGWAIEPIRAATKA